MIDPVVFHDIAETVRGVVRSQNWEIFLPLHHHRIREITQVVGVYTVWDDRITISGCLAHIGMNGELFDSHDQPSLDVDVVHLYTHPRVYPFQVNAELMLQHLHESLRLV